MYYPDSVIDEVRSRNDIVSVVGQYVTLKRAGSGYQGLCPFHSEKTPSFHVTPSRQTYKCFGCQKGGNVFTFVMEYENVSFPEALRILADRVGYELPKVDYSEKSAELRNKRERMLALYKEAAEYYYRKLRSDVGRYGMEYFVGRELNAETMRQFGLGYSDGKLYNEIKDRYEDEFLRESGLFTFRENGGAGDKFFNRVMFPIFDNNGRVIAFGGRVMGDAKPKYLNSPESLIFNKSRNLYHLNAARKSRRGYLILCEGYMDVISLTQAGFDNAIATLGTALTEQQAQIIARFTKDVVLTYDSDGAGQTAISRAIPILYGAGIRARVVDMKPYKDPDEFIKNLGAEEYEKRIREARSSYRFEMEYLQTQYGDINSSDNTDGMNAFIDAAARWMVRQEDELERETYMKAFCADYKVSYQAFTRKVNTIGAEAAGRAAADAARAQAEAARAAEVLDGDGEAQVAPNGKAGKRDEILNTQDYLVTILGSRPRARRVVRKYLSVDDFTGNVYRDVVKRCYELPEGETADVATIVSRFETAEEQRLAADMLSDEMALRTGDVSKAVEDAVMKIHKRRTEEKIAKAKEENNLNEASRLIRESRKETEALRRQLRTEVYG
ncbi:MAG: DNA primase [Lachnospiraceae bacterium]|nr:DNA primase [Lachnospiraceae bacterium]